MAHFTELKNRCTEIDDNNNNNNKTNFGLTETLDREIKGSENTLGTN